MTGVMTHGLEKMRKKKKSAIYVMVREQLAAMMTPALSVGGADIMNREEDKMSKCDDCKHCRVIVFEMFGKGYGCDAGMPQRWGINVLECDGYEKKN